jgi:hypothetical protein
LQKRKALAWGDLTGISCFFARYLTTLYQVASYKSSNKMECLLVISRLTKWNVNYCSATLLILNSRAACVQQTVQTLSYE